ncbi:MULTISPECIES: FAD-dependent monooxygenase [Actinomadura]|uniref:FAD-dependent monooxygenase n=2 Tax=Actinomadura yumaensis TaxID=111807 RepID=A0ABW2CQQ5_9ACTN|nr:FAD-dependent monooxygenase [Actinomadura sp. J1-007]MWK36694.1 NAD(P)-binding protein [Actinomadura sp. J1-007]
MPAVRNAIVVGAGIGGLTAAIGLRRAGVETTVLERRSTPDRLLTGGGFMLWHNAVLALRELKLDQAVADAGVEIVYHEFRSDRDRRLARWDVAPEAERHGAPALGLRRSALNAVLMEAAGDVRLGARCASFDQDEDGVTVTLDGGETLRADVLVGADGIRSTVRDGMRKGHDLPLRYAGYTAWQAITRLPGEETVPTGTFFNLWGRGGLRFLYMRLNEDEVYWDAITADGAGASFDMLANGRRDVLLDAYRDWPEPVPRILASTAEDAILPIGIFDRPPDRCGGWGHGRVVLLGDAAHPMTLNLSQGAGQAIEDAVALVRLLSEHERVPAAIRAYEDLRLERVAGMVGTAWTIGAMGRWRGRLRCAGRDLFMRAFFDRVGRKQSYQQMMDVRF